MLSLGKVCEQPLLSLTRICENGKWKMENYSSPKLLLPYERGGWEGWSKLRARPRALPLLS